MTEWCPSSLLQTDEIGYLPLHWVITDSLRSFRVVVDTAIRYYPRWRGIQLLHQKDRIHGLTPFQLANRNFGHTAVLTILDNDDRKTGLKQ